MTLAVTNRSQNDSIQISKYKLPWVHFIVTIKMSLRPKLDSTDFSLNAIRNGKGMKAVTACTLGKDVPLSVYKYNVFFYLVCLFNSSYICTSSSCITHFLRIWPRGVGGGVTRWQVFLTSVYNLNEILTPGM